LPYLRQDGVTLFYEDVGSGSAVITTHGLLENSTYWSLPGVTARLSLHHRVISLDMRGHGRTSVAEEVEGFNVDTLCADIDHLADELGLDRFHLVTHATGGMVGARYAMRESGRLLSLVLSDASSATMVGPRAGFEQLAQLLEGGSWPALHDVLREPLGAFLFRLDVHPERDRVWDMVHRCFELGDPVVLARFVRAFYTDPDPKVEELRRVSCSTLVIVGEHDRALMKPSRLIADEIPGARLVIIEGVGHMTAIEAPEATTAAITEFLAAQSV
jgi:pimeloyl-ACP methyl ester carboxylesterase